MIIPQRIRALLGFSRKSGQLLVGEKAVKNCLKAKKACLVFLATDFPEKRRNYLCQWCQDEGVHYLIGGTKQEYGEILGVNPCALFVLTDIKMAEQIINSRFADGVSENNGR